MTIIQCIVVLALIFCVYGQLVLQKRQLEAVSEGRASRRLVADYDSRVFGPAVESIRYGPRAPVSPYQKLPTHKQMKDFPHSRGIGGYRWPVRIPYPKRPRFGSESFFKQEQDRRFKSNEVSTSSQGQQNVVTPPELGTLQKQRAGRLSLDFPTSTEVPGGRPGRLRRSGSARPSTRPPPSPESSPSRNPEDHFFQRSPQVPSPEDLDNGSIATPGMCSFLNLI
ncbi:secreted protein [Melampsora americana]|nr:secreted protein [Melampsora americana]